MKVLKNNLNKIILLVIYIVMFYAFSELLYNIFSKFATTEDKKILFTILINVIIYLILFVSGAVLLKTEIKADYNILNKTSALSVFGMCSIGIVLAYIANYVGSFLSMAFGGTTDSVNQQTIEIVLMSKYGFIMAIITMFIGPIVEELVFRKGIHQLLRGYKVPSWAILIISSILFGLIHVLDAGDFVYVFPYIFMGLVLGGLEIYSRNIYPSIIVHSFINTVSVFMIFYMEKLDWLFGPMGM